MKDNTKNLIVAAGIAAAGLYVVTTMDSDGDGYGFAGGGGGVPLLPQLEDAAGAGGDTIYNLPAPITDSPFGGWDDMPDAEDVIEGSKKVIIPATLEFNSPTGYKTDINPVTGLTRSTGTAIRTTPEGTGLFHSIGNMDLSTIEKESTWWNPFSWDRGAVIEKYLTWSQKHSMMGDKNYLGQTTTLKKAATVKESTLRADRANISGYRSGNSGVGGMMGKAAYEGRGSAVSYATYKKQYKEMNE